MLPLIYIVDENGRSLELFIIDRSVYLWVFFVIKAIIVCLSLSLGVFCN